MFPGSEKFVSRPIDPAVLRATIPSKLKLHEVDQQAIDDLDPLTYEVVRHRLWSVTDEMGETLKRMSGSPIVTDANDFDFTLNDEIGQAVQVGLYNTMLVGAIDLALSWTLLHRAENPGIEEGDMFLCNDPWIGGGLHQNDVLIFQPVFHEGRLFGWTNAICHQPDLGGSAIGSAPIGNVDVFAEALPTPPIKIVRNGEIQQDVLDAWVRRSRVPLIVGLDLRAKVGANNIGRTRLLEVVEQYGADVVKAVMKRMLGDAESRLRQKLRELPEGTWSATGYQDQAFLGDRGTHKTVVTMTNRDGHLVFDFTGTDPQVGIINCTYGGCRGGIMLALLPMLAGDIPWSAGGLMRCFDIVTPEGTLNNARFPAAVNRAPLGSAWMIGNLVAQCLSLMLDRNFEMRKNLQASCCGTFNVALIAGVDERNDTAVPFLNAVMDSVAGGYGARADRDGISTGGNFCIPMGRVPDVEITELLYPLLVLWRREEIDSGGPGRQRGGASSGVAMTPYGTSLPANILLSSSGKATAQSPGLAGGYPGNLGYDVVVQGADVLTRMANGQVPGTLADLQGTQHVTQCHEEGTLAPGDVLYLNCQGGGGYGDPLHRDPAAVLRDVEAGIVSLRAADEIYGVVLAHGSGVDREATDLRRVALRVERRRGSSANGLTNHKADVVGGVPIDDNLTAVTVFEEHRIACRHCGEIISDGAGRLHVSELSAQSTAAGPSVRVDPNVFIDAPVHFLQFTCPDCSTALYTTICPKDARPTVSGFQVAPRHATALWE
ncbi:hydantoinase B/oxoprolinase family protein [Polymorphobacter sp. PAMC 29334]|uniref:hydantoinase B/oxoprolinase family protein n=1 Tax=Polymorphobacter sp. PAMC 29334 TaxID=2862331 RepID=UPI001C66D9C0|nr:hydantoinase B/oxoprolinase family protein [Polymorphobacter sp. PAMC 29334]QYE36364.1 hydantoinase B/oxoprolinase family protein [Polymorphobacter sp. PAMC 29334]